MNGRPQYESGADRANENAMWPMLEKALGGTLHKLPQQYGLDWMLCTEEGVALKWIELKARNHEYGAYPTYAISMSKVMRAIALERDTGLPSLLVVRYLNVVYIAYFRSFIGGGGKGFVRVGGRKDRGDPQDVEPMWHLPIGQMTKLCDLEKQDEEKKES